MRVPADAIAHHHFDEGHAGFHQAAGHQAALAEAAGPLSAATHFAAAGGTRAGGGGGAVHLADIVGLARKVESLFLLRVHQAHGSIDRRAMGWPAVLWYWLWNAS